MSASNEWFEHHLTPRGWVPGSRKLDFAGMTDVPAPEDRVMTVTNYEYLSSPHSKLERWSEVTWTSNDGDRIAALQAEFGAQPGDSKTHPLR